MNPNMPNMPRQSSGGTGFVIATVILLVVIVAGAFYFWRARSSSPAYDSTMSGIENQSSSDDTASIEADLNTTDVENVDYDLTESNFTAS